MSLHPPHRRKSLPNRQRKGSVWFNFMRFKLTRKPLSRRMPTLTLHLSKLSKSQTRNKSKNGLVPWNKKTLFWIRCKTNLVLLSTAKTSKRAQLCQLYGLTHKKRKSISNSNLVPGYKNHSKMTKRMQLSEQARPSQGQVLSKEKNLTTLSADKQRTVNFYHW